MQGRFSVAVLTTIVMSLLPAIPVGAAESTARVLVVNQRSEVQLGGTVIPARQVTIAAQLPGRVEYIAGEEGDVFERNKALVALDDDELLAQRQAAMAQMANAEAALRNAGVQYNRELISPSHRNTMSGMGMPGLFDQMFTRNFSDMLGIQDSGMERHANLYARSTGVEQARSGFWQARSKVLAIDTRLRDTVGYSPFDGVIVKKLVEVGDTVQPGQPLLVYADTTSLQLRVEVPARLMSGVREGGVVPVTLDVGEVTVEARVAQIFPMADPVRHTVTVKLDLPPDLSAAAGMYAEARIPDNHMPNRRLPTVPVSAVVHRGSLPTVCVVDGMGAKELRVIRPGPSLENGRLAVLAGLSGGEDVLVDASAGNRCR